MAETASLGPSLGVGPFVVAHEDTVSETSDATERTEAETTTSPTSAASESTDTEMATQFIAAQTHVDESDEDDRDVDFEDDDEELDEDEDDGEDDDDDEGNEGDADMDDGDDAGSYSTQANNPSPPLAGLKEIGNLASWTVSSAKPGNGVEQMRDEDTNLFWQSDGPQPHHINIHFAKRVKVARMRMHLDFDNDESYTPTKITVLSGTGYHDLQLVCKMELERPTGWVDVPMDNIHEDGQLRTFLIQFSIHANHQNGKDTHVRGLQIFAREATTLQHGEIPFTSTKMMEEFGLR